VNLLIVESPTKAKKIQPMLGSSWNVVASAGHIRDLPKSSDGRDVSRYVPDAPGVLRDTYQLEYEILAKKLDVVKRLRAAAKSANAIYLATDPDREGEAIAWHIKDTLRIGGAMRVTFHEITKTAITKSLREPRVIDANLVAAQEARRAIDRIFGYRVSASLRRCGSQARSAGRVQTVAVLMVVDRELQIRSFQSRVHYVVSLVFDDDGKPWRAEWHFKPFLNGEEKLWIDKDVAERVAAFRHLRVGKCDETVSAVSPPPPFTTTTLQQAASIALRFRVSRTMQIAQKLFELGYITYHRTDSQNLSAEAVEAIRRYAQGAGLPIPLEDRQFASKANAQEAHEAIRMTHVEETLAGASDVDADTRRLYELIRKRAIASQLADAQYDVRTVVLEAKERLNGCPVHFVARGRTLRVAGFRVLVDADEAEERSEDPAATNPAPRLTVGAPLTADDGVADARKTKPPTRYSEAALVKSLEAKGIGRPSTYATIISKIQEALYVEEKERKFWPTALGEALIAATRPSFSFVDLRYTADMEAQLDEVASGKLGYADIVRGANETLNREFAAFDGRALSIASGGPECPTCKQGVLVKRARRTKSTSGAPPKGVSVFWSCARFPQCNAAFNDAGGQPDLTPRPPRFEGGACPACGTGTLLLRKNGRGPWWGCSRYHDGCAAIFADAGGKPNSTPIAPRVDPFHDPNAEKCPKCKKGVLAPRNGSSGPFWRCFSRGKAKRKCSYTCEDLGGKPQHRASVWEHGRTPAQSVAPDTRSRQRSIGL
jgi:DNA topoisomerase-1